MRLPLLDCFLQVGKAPRVIDGLRCRSITGMDEIVDQAQPVALCQGPDLMLAVCAAMQMPQIIEIIHKGVQSHHRSSSSCCSIWSIMVV